MQFGIQDDAWLADGPGHARPPARRRAEPRRHDRPLQHPLGSGRAEEAGACARVERSRVSLGRQPTPSRTACTNAASQPLVTLYGSPAWANGGRKANAPPKSSRDVRRLRVRGGEALPVRPQVDDLERAEPEPLSRRDVAEPLREDAAQPGLRGDPSREPARARRRRRDRAAREPRRLRPARLGARARTLRTRSSTRTRTTRIRRGRARRRSPAPAATATSSRWRTWAGCRSRCSTTSGTSRSGSRSTATRRTRPTCSASPPSLQAAYIGEAAMRAYQLSGVSLLIQYLLQDEPYLDRFQTGLFTVHGVPKPGYAAFRFPLAQVTRQRRDARRCGGRSGRARARGRTGMEVSKRRQVALGRAEPARRTASALSPSTLNAPKGSLVRSGRRPTAPSAGRPGPLVTIARREGRHPRRRDRDAAASAHAHHEQAPAADLRPADGDYAIEALVQRGHRPS